MSEHESNPTSGEGFEAAVVAGAARALIDSTRDIILMVRPNGTIVLANSAAERAYGWNRDELRGMNIKMLREPASREAVPLQIETAMESGILFETVHVDRDGKRFPVEVSSRGITIGGDKLVLSVIRDISARRRREKEREDLLAELEDANRHLEGLLRVVSGAVGRDDVETLLRETLSVLREVMQADAALLFRRESERWILDGSAGYPDLEAGFSFPVGQGFASRVAEAGEALWLSNVTESDAYMEEHGRLGIRAMLGVPLYLEGELFGALECTWATDRIATDAERMMLQVAADRVMVAVSSVRRFEGTRRSRDIEKALAEAAAKLTSSHRLEEMLPETLGVMAQALGCDGAVFGSYRDGVFVVEHSVGVEVGMIPAPDHQKRMHSVAVAPPVVHLGEGANDIAALRDSLHWAEALITPVRVRGEWVGALLFGRRACSGGFDHVADEALVRLSRVLSLAYANARDFQMEHRIAEVLQESILRLESSVDGVRFGHRYRSSTTQSRVGGDLYDVFPMGGGLVGAFIGDVSGKGLEAAVFTTLVKQTVRAFAHEASSPAEIMSRSNSVLAGSSRMRDFASALLVVIEPESGKTVYCRAGHPPAMIVRSDGTVEQTEWGSPVIGAFADMHYEEDHFTLADGDLLVMYTDGITEARDAEEEFFGEERLVEVCRGLAGLDPDAAAGRIEDAVESFTEGRLSDDIAILVIARA